MSPTVTQRSAASSINSMPKASSRSRSTEAPCSSLSRPSEFGIDMKWDRPRRPRSLWLSDHVDFANRLAHPAGSLPILGKEGKRIGLDFDRLAGLMRVGAASGDEMAVLVAGDVAVPVSGR